MHRKFNVAVIGSGNVGKELIRQLGQRGHSVVAIATRRSVLFPTYRAQPVKFHEIAESPEEILRRLVPIFDHIDVGMLAIGNGNKGADELAYMRTFAAGEKPIVTCAKAAHAYHFDEVSNLGVPVGRRATVGGGTDMLEMLRRRHLANENVIIHAVLNGTLNFVWSTIQQGGSLATAIAQAKALGYAEPNGGSDIDILNGELHDVAMKAAILHNVALSYPSMSHMNAKDVRINELTSKDIGRLTSRNARYRFIITFSSIPDYDAVPKDSPGAVHASCGRWTISGGFHNVMAESPFYDWLLQVDGVNNGFIIHSPTSEDVGYSLTGPGAGPLVTARAVIRDLEELPLAV